MREQGTYVTLCTMCMHVVAYMRMYVHKHDMYTSLLNRFEMHAHSHRQTVAMTWREVCAPRLRAPHSRSKMSAAAFLPPAASRGHGGAASGDTAGGTKAAARRRNRIAATRAPCHRGTPSLEGSGAHRGSSVPSTSSRTSIPLPRMTTAGKTTAALKFIAPLPCGSPTSRMMVMVEFPGIVVNDAAALATFGGAAGVAAALRTPGAMLPLHLRPEDPQGTAIFGDRVPTKNLVVRVVRRRGAPSGAPVRAEVVARVPEAFSFKGMADFQVPRGVKPLSATPGAPRPRAALGSVPSRV